MPRRVACGLFVVMATNVELSRPEQQTLMQRAKSLESRLSGLKEKSQKAAGDLQHKAMVFGAGYVLGQIEARAESRGEAMPTMFGLDPKLLYAGGAYAASQYAGGEIAKLGHAVTDAMAAIYGHDLGRDQGRRTASEDARRRAAGGGAPAGGAGAGGAAPGGQR